jgi:hypothetical protein
MLPRRPIFEVKIMAVTMKMLAVMTASDCNFTAALDGPSVPEACSEVK